MSKAKMGAVVMYGGHNACFVADIWRVGNVNVVKAHGNLDNCLSRDPCDIAEATHHVSDFPEGGFWRSDIGVFVVPEHQVKELKKKS